MLYQLVERDYPLFTHALSGQGRHLPGFVEREFEDFLRCGRLEHGILRVVCDACKHEKLVAFSCKRRGFFPSCGARRMAESAALLAGEVLARQAGKAMPLHQPPGHQHATLEHDIKRTGKICA